VSVNVTHSNHEPHRFELTTTATARTLSPEPRRVPAINAPAKINIIYGISLCDLKKLITVEMSRDRVLYICISKRI